MIDYAEKCKNLDTDRLIELRRGYWAHADRLNLILSGQRGGLSAAEREKFLSEGAEIMDYITAIDNELRTRKDHE